MITVIGSLNMDLVVTAERAPEQGETVTGTGFAQIPGGKGANQAVAAARGGARVAMAGRVGDDAYGRALVEALEKDPVDTSAIEKIPGIPTGIAAITVDQKGHNRIVVVPGANGRLTPKTAEDLRGLIARSRVLLLQLEIPLDAVGRAIEIAREEGVCCILNPAPALSLPDFFYTHVDMLTPNETELALLSGRTDIREGARVLLERGLATLLVTLGEDGALLLTPEGERHFPAYRVAMTDSTAAGDCFNGNLAAGMDRLLEGRTADKTFVPSLIDLVPVIDRAMKAAAISVTRQGAQPSLPEAEEIDRFDSWYPEHRL